jgi:non-specific serine/threonine protein kinase
VAGLCRLPEDLSPADLTPPSEENLLDLIENSPPLTGGEYLSIEALTSIWRSLVEFTTAALAEEPAKASEVLFEADQTGSLSAFLNRRAPLWRRVGRVTFNLAENKADDARPFAFMVTYVASLTGAGRDRHLPLGRALKLYAAAKDQPALQSLLAPVREAAKKLNWVNELVKNQTIFQPIALTIRRAYRFLMDIPVLEECGLTCRIPNWWAKRPKARVDVVIGANKKPVVGLSSLLDWDVQLAVGDLNLSHLEIAELLSGDPDDRLVLFKGQWLEVDRAKLQEALAHWQTLKESHGPTGLDFVNAMRLLAGLPGSFGGSKAKEDLLEPDPWVVPRAGEELNAILQSLRNPDNAEQPPELKGVLRPYQQKGLAWLALLSGLGLGACLADDMGLGKTIQVLALLLLDLKRRPALGPSILVGPASLLANWRLEAARFAPSLRTLVWHPSELSGDKMARLENNPEELRRDFDLVVVSYGLLTRRISFFEKINFRLAILDEAQAIKNPTTAQSKAVRKLKAESRLTLTGTPIENRLTDLWSLFDFLNPGLLSSLSKFQKAINALEKNKESDLYAPLRRLVSPYILRRLKTDRTVIDDLPDKIETPLHCYLTEIQAKLYAQVVNALDDALQRLKTEPENDAARRGLVLQFLTRFRQVINHPAHLTGDNDWDPAKSGKFTRLAELGREMAERQDRLLVFTQYREIIPPLRDHLTTVFERPGLVLHGGTKIKERQEIVEAFQADGGPPFLILSLKAGGTGLNLTAAGQVIHFDRWWNPAVEDQATDRAYRIGQKKNVIVHKCVTMGTLEEKVDQMLTDKRNLANDVLNKNRDQELDLTNLSDEALLATVSLDLNRAVL